MVTKYIGLWHLSCRLKIYDWLPWATHSSAFCIMLLINIEADANNNQSALAL